MKRTITLSLFVLITLCCWAKNITSAKDSLCIIEGTIKNIPEGCDIILYGTAGKYSGKQKTVAQIKKGKFRFEKKVKDNEKYELFLYPCIESLTLYISPGTKTTITGNGTHPSTWLVKSNNVQQQEWNAYQEIEVDSLSEYASTRLRLNEIETELYKNKTESEKESLLKEREELTEKQKDLSKNYVEVLYNFMKDRQYSDIFESKLKPMLEKAEYVDKKEDDWDATCSNKVRELQKRIPQKQDALKDSLSTEKSVSFFKKVISTSEKDKGWCTFYDTEKSYEADSHTDVYIICEVKTDGIIEMSDKSDKIIPANCPVILHLNTQLENGMYCAILTETKKTRKKTNISNMNFLDVSVKGEIIKAWRIGFSTEENNLALYPWETNNAEGDVVYFKIPNSYIKNSKFDIAWATTKWNIEKKFQIGHTQWHTRNLQKNTFTIGTNISYCEKAITTAGVMKVMTLQGQPIKVADGNEFIYPRFLVGNTFFEDKLWGEKNFYLCHFGKDGWETPKSVFCNQSNYRALKFSKMKDNAVLFTDGHGVGHRSATIIPDASSIENILDTTQWKRYDLSKLTDKFISIGQNLYSLSDSTFLLPGAPQVAKYEIEEDYLMSIINFKNQTCIPLKYNIDDGIEASKFEKHWVYTDNAKVFGNGKGHFLYMYYRENLVFIFTIENERINIIKYLHSTFPEYYPNNGNTPIKKKVLTEEVYCETTNDNIYILTLDRDKFGKKIKREDYDNNFFFGDIVKIYDWDGKQQKNVLKLDHIGRRILISDDHKTLYLFTDDFWGGEPNPKIWAYDISNLDTQTGMEFLDETIDYADNTTQKNIVSEQKPTINFVEEGDMMADFELYDYDDKPHHLNEFLGNGKYTILEFSGLGCGPCQAAKPFLEKFYKDNKDRFEIITVSTDGEKLWKRKPTGEVSWHEWNDHKSAREISLKYGVQAIPTFFIISTDGKIEKKCVGVQTFLDAIKVKKKK